RDRWLQSPSLVRVRRTTLLLQFFEVRAHIFLSRRHQRRRETIIDGFGDGLHGRVSGTQGGEDLTLALQSMLDVPGERTRWIVDRRSVRRQQAFRVERLQARERAQVLREIAASARVNHHAAAEHYEIAAE